MTQTKAAIYCRVSTEVQHEKGYSLQEQERICREYGKSKDYEIVTLLSDDISGATFIRPGMNKILELAKQKAIKVVLVQELDRFARDSTALVILEHQLKLYEVEVDYILNNFQPGALGNFHKTIAIGVAELEKEMIKIRTRRGRMGKVRSGKVLSGARSPYGYYFENDMFHIEENEARIVGLIFDWYTKEKLGVVALAKRLSSMNVPTRGDKLGLNRKKNPGVWNASTIHKMLQSETYVGKWNFNKTQRIKDSKQRNMYDRSEWIEVSIPAIIDQKVFDMAQEQRKLNSHYNKRNTKHEYLLPGMMVCAHCGRPFLASRKYSTHRVIIYYRCSAQEERNRISFLEDAPQCKYPYLRGDVVETIVWNEISEVIQNPMLILEATLNRKNEHAEQDATAQMYQTALEVEIAAIENQEKKLLDLFLSSKLEQEILEAKAHELKTRRQHLQVQLLGIKKQFVPVTIDEQTAHEIVDYCAIIAQGLPLMNTIERRNILKLLQVKVIVDRKTKELSISGLLPTRVATYSIPIYWSEIKHY